jgi:integron integrase
MSINQTPTLLDEVRNLMRTRHYSIHTERAYCDWIKRYIRFHGMTSREDLRGAEKKIEAFLTHLAVAEQVAPSTQNQAMNALVFLYKQVLRQPLQDDINAVRAPKQLKVPVVMSREEVRIVLALMQGTPQLIAKLLYGCGLHVMEAVRLRVQDIDVTMKQVTVRSGKGAKDRYSTFPASVIPALEDHLRRVRVIHERDLSEGFGAVYLPYALARKYKSAARDWNWQYVFPARDLSLDPRSGIKRRHHVDPSVVNKAIKVVVRCAGIQKQVSAHTFRRNPAYLLMSYSIVKRGGSRA